MKRGITLLEVLVSALIMGTLCLSILSLVRNGQKQTRYRRAVASYSHIVDTIARYVRIHASLRNTYSHAPLEVPPPGDDPSLREPLNLLFRALITGEYSSITSSTSLVDGSGTPRDFCLRLFGPITSLVATGGGVGSGAVSGVPSGCWYIDRSAGNTLAQTTVADPVLYGLRGAPCDESIEGGCVYEVTTTFRAGCKPTTPNSIATPSTCNRAEEFVIEYRVHQRDGVKIDGYIQMPDVTGSYVVQRSALSH